MVMVNDKIDNDIKMHLCCGNFKGLAEAPEQYRWHHPMQLVQGYLGSHWMLPSSNYLLRITPAAARQQANKQQSTNTPTLLAVLMATAMPRYNTVHIAQWRRSRASQEATERRHWASIVANCIKGTWLRRFVLMFFIINKLKKVPG
jgi:hypothetical protein